MRVGTEKGGARIALKRSAMEKQFSTWLPQSVSAGGKYDIMISYRQATEREFAQALSDCFSVEAVGESGAEPTVFYDQVSLKAGERFDLAFMNAVAHARVCVPLVSEGAISRMLDTTKLDNVLLEWALMTFLQTQGVVARVQPVLIGRVTSGGQMRSLFSGFNPRDLPDEVNEEVQNKVWMGGEGGRHAEGGRISPCSARFPPNAHPSSFFSLRILLRSTRPSPPCRHGARCARLCKRSWRTRRCWPGTSTARRATAAAPMLRWRRPRGIFTGAALRSWHALSAR